ncbi:MAG: hypothetical protein M0P72_07980 [Metallibacterium scheffleri]|jgi:hypothetical protein|uniref:hypothetical protein n=1 Tax=Metallibacterium scheffleri TaxID=993689 RepID=UPI0026E9A545|nr:hypothetical protein [Metallibacterium scheffleri]MCK9367071.1 hypothetical protein [Metallibacterium scheffleri]
MRKHLLAVAVAATLAGTSFGARADALSDIFTQGHIDGQLRAYYFTRSYDTSAVPDASAFSGAALINMQSGTFGGGFSLGASFVTANSFGTQSGTPAKIDSTLMGINDSVSALGQAYVQYKNEWMMLRGGYQYLNTPWLGQSDSRVIPASYNAVSAVFKPAKGWDVYALRSFDWKSRTSGGYYADNLYYPATFNGDAMYGGIGGLPATAHQSNGAWALGTSYGMDGFKGQAWYYNFLDFARMGYLEGSYTFKTGTGFDPFVGAQYVDESGSGNNFLVSNHTALFGVAGSRVKSSVWGVTGGVIIPNGRIDLGYNKVGSESGAVGGGAIISPYTAAYATDPLYTTSMIRGLVEMGPGHAWKAKVTYNVLKNFQVIAAYAKYTTQYRGNSHDVYLDLIYNLDGYLKGLTLRNRWERSSGGWNLNPGNKPFTYNRVMISYAF